ncbi:LutC/YkgG family protein [Scopulibacillus cellulosilyticus]|uniref:Lactate utilization protein C n=1 Tax=Scopulibacillus cellulosilyticus TaxID=2665665 RepID=A0ABW2Q239_9BACL
MSKGTIKNRDSFLENIAERLGRSTLETVDRSPRQYHPERRVYQGCNHDDLLSIFKKASASVHTEVFETDVSTLNKTIQDVVNHFGGGPVVTWDDPRFKEYGVNLDSNDIHVWDLSHGKENIDKAEQANVGITFSDVTLAESGTVILFNDKYKARAVSLLPRNFIAIVPKSSIVPRMTQAACSIHERIKAGKDIATCINFISGPSNSGDIEMNLVQGVHGPVNASYIIVIDR